MDREEERQFATVVCIENYNGQRVEALVLRQVNEGALAGWYYLQMPSGERCYMARRWCHPLSDDKADRQYDTDWRKFLGEHWDKVHDHCKVDCLDEFMSIFLRAAAHYMQQKPTVPAGCASMDKPQPKKSHYVKLSFFDLI